MIFVSSVNITKANKYHSKNEEAGDSIPVSQSPDDRYKK